MRHKSESFGDYENALSMATAAKFDLQNIEVDTDLPPTIPVNLLDIFLNEYIGRMQDKVTAMKESSSGGSQFWGIRDYQHLIMYLSPVRGGDPNEKDLNIAVFTSGSSVLVVRGVPGNENVQQIGASRIEQGAVEVIE